MNKILEAVKTRLGITGTAQDALLLALIEDVKAYALNAGVDPNILEMPRAYGLISLGVNDLYGAGSGNGVFSDMFSQRVIQLSREKVDDIYIDGYDIAPKTEDIVLNTAGKNMESNITVQAVTADIDTDIKPQNIVKGVNILGVEGTVTEGYSEYTGPTTVKPKTEAQILNTTKTSLETDITVQAVDPTIDPDIRPENIRKGVDILGVTGTFDKLPPYEGSTAVSPSTTAQTLPTRNTSVLEDITIAPVTSTIDSNIQASNIKKGATILGVQGAVEERLPTYIGQYDITPTTHTLSFKTKDKSVTTDLTVNAVTSAIDPNIKAENIKKDVEILGVKGTLEAGGGELSAIPFTNMSNSQARIDIAHDIAPFMTMDKFRFFFPIYKKIQSSMTMDFYTEREWNREIYVYFGSDSFYPDVIFKSLNINLYGTTAIKYTRLYINDIVVISTRSILSVDCDNTSYSEPGKFHIVTDMSNRKYYFCGDIDIRNVIGWETERGTIVLNRLVFLLGDDGVPRTLTINDDPATVSAFKARESEINAKNYTIVPVHYDPPVIPMTLEEPVMMDEPEMLMAEAPQEDDTGKVL